MKKANSEEIGSMSSNTLRHKMPEIILQYISEHFSRKPEAKSSRTKRQFDDLDGWSVNAADSLCVARQLGAAVRHAVEDYTARVVDDAVVARVVVSVHQHLFDQQACNTTRAVVHATLEF